MKNKLTYKNVERTLRKNDNGKDKNDNAEDKNDNAEDKNEEPERDRSREIIDQVKDYGAAAGAVALSPIALLSMLKDHTPIQTIK